MKSFGNYKSVLFPAIVTFFLAIDFYLVFIYAPVEKVQGLVQKIFYLHVSSAFAMYLGFLLAGLFALLFLLKRKNIWDAHAQTGTFTGLLFCTMVLVSGPIWAKPIWGAWWTWDPRLTTTLILWLIFLSSILLRKSFGLDPRGKIYASILILFGLVDIPLVFFAVKLWRGIHPSVLGQEGSMTGSMRFVLIFSIITVFLLFSLIYWIRLRTSLLEERIEELETS